MALTDPTHYHDKTDPQVIRVLAQARRDRTRIRVTYGDTETGRDWMEEHMIMGYVGRSTGRLPILLLVHNTRSRGGPGILTHCIVRIETTRGHRLLYLHPKYQLPDLILVPTDPGQMKYYGLADYPWTVNRKEDDGYTVVARFGTKEKARNWIAFMTHERNRP